MINYERLKQFCAMGFEGFKHYGEVVYSKDGRKSTLVKGGAYIFQDNGSAVLGVCHLDYVNLPFHYAVADLGGDCVFCPRLDDRLGVYLLLDVLPALVNVPYDVLLTTGEESGKSSARFFVPPRDYNWAFELDRRGLDAVTYGQDSKAFRAAIGAAGLSIGAGSFSDICLLDSDCCAVNFGIGYHDEHTRICHAFGDDIIKQVGRAARFYNDNHRIQYIASASVYSWGGRSYYGGGSSWGDWSGYDGGDFCEYCGSDLSGVIPYVFNGSTICPACYDYLIKGL